MNANMIDKNFASALGSMAEQDSRVVDRLARVDLPEKHPNAPGACIGVLGISSGTGATSLSYALAEAIANKVVMLDISLPHGNFSQRDFDVLGLDKRFDDASYASFYSLLDTGKPLQNLENLYNKVNWQVRAPKEDHLIDLADIYRIRNAFSQNNIICDIQSSFFYEQLLLHQDKSRQLLGFLFDFSLLICVVDPFPARLIAGVDIFSFIQYFKQKGGNVLFVVNKENSGINKKELVKYLKTKDYISLGTLPSSEIYEASYNCKTLANAFAKNKETRLGFNQLLKAISFF
jgi:hypothetical protein